MRTIRLMAVVSLVGAAMSHAQATLPATQTTALAAVSTAANAPAAVPAVNRAHAAIVKCAHGDVEVSADDSSLNQILRDIGRQTGMKITGGVVDERVFGRYGPAPLDDVLSDLLEGTGSNMLLREATADIPAELILSPRGGGATPPNPNAAAAADEAQRAAAPRRDYRQQEPGQRNTDEPEPSQAAAAAVAEPARPAAPAANGSGAGPAGASGSMTPQQIYQQLQQLQKTQPKQ